MHITGMPYVPGTAQGRLQTGTQSITPGSIVMLRQSELSALSTRPAGLLVVDGAPFSHAMIALLGAGIPAIVISAHQAAVLEEGTPVVVDGTRGRVSRGVAAEVSRQPLPMPGHPVQTADGVAVHLYASVSGVAAARQARHSGADAIGLVRSEYFLPSSGAAPDAAYYHKAITGICEAADPLVITVRLLDLAADKLPEWALSGHVGTGGGLGLQGVRLYGVPAVRRVLMAQLAALDGVDGKFNLRVLIPYLVRLEELQYWRDFIGRHLSRPLPIGAMVETPAAALDIANWLAVSDFVAVGCNDLMQCLFAADRDRSDVRHYLDPCAPPLFRFFRQMAEAAAGELHRVQLCGLLPQLPGVLPVLLGLGFRTFSVDAALIPGLAQTLQAHTLSGMQTLAGGVCAAKTSDEVTQLSCCSRPPFLLPGWHEANGEAELQ
jgi:phosphoenolpyruvate-protein kinase (PTS system EI component)